MLSRPSLIGLGFVCAISIESTHELLKIDLVSVELRAIDARELHLTIYAHATCAAHPGTVDHDAVQTHESGYLFASVVLLTNFIMGTAQPQIRGQSSDSF